MSKNIVYQLCKQFNSADILSIISQISMNSTLSFTAKGILTVLITTSKASITIKDLIAVDGSDRPTVNTVNGLKQLFSQGFISKKQLHGEKGKFGAMQLVISWPLTVDQKISLKEKEKNKEKEEKEKRTKKEKEEKENKKEKEISSKKNENKKKFLKEDFQKIYDAFHPGRKTRVYPFEQFRTRVEKAVNQFGSVELLIAHIAEYLDYLTHPAVSSWRQKKTFPAWINDPESLNTNWVLEKQKAEKQEQLYRKKKRPKTKHEEWLEAHEKVLADIEGGSND